MSQKILYIGTGLSLISLATLMFFFPVEVLAVTFDPTGTLQGAGLPTTSFSETAFKIVKGILQIIGFIALALIIYGGFTIMTGGGNQDKIQQGKDVLVWAIIGAAIILSSLGILEFIDSFI